MRPDQRDKAYLWDMLDAAEAVLDFVRDKTPKDYLADRMLRGAVERHIEIIGEAARHVSAELKQAHPEIPWRAMIGQRNILAHEYGEVRHEMIWNVATLRIPDLVAAIRAILPEEEDE
jgi:uncharacterized protein with HEPN domain